MKIFTYLKPIIFLLLLLSTGWKGYCQADKLRFEHLTIADGLSHNTVSCILEDKKGYLWFGARDGLNRYDGYNFKVYKFDPADSTSLPQNEITTLWEDLAGTLWIGTTGGGLSKFDPTTEKFTEYKPKVHSDNYRSVSSINEDREGMMWIGTYGGELHRFNKQTGEFSSNYELGFNNLPDSLKNMVGHEVIFDIYKDRSNNLWIGSITGLHKLNLTPEKKDQSTQISFTHYRHDPKNAKSLGSRIASKIYEDHAGMLWIQSRGLNRFDPKTGTFTRYLHDPQNPYSISHNNISQMVEDKQGNLWIGTHGGGLNKLNKERTQFTASVQDVTDPASLSSNLVSSLLIDKAGTLWLGTVGNGISKTSLQREKFALYGHNPFNANSLSDGAVTAICEDSRGILWVGTNNKGLNRLDRKTGTFTYYRHDPSNPKSLWSDFISDMMEDKEGNVWICHNIGRSGKISKLNRDIHGFEHSVGNTDLDQILAKNFLFTIYEDRQGIIWVGTGNGLIQYNRKTNQYIHYTHDPNNMQGLSDYEARAIGEDIRGNLWIGHGSIALTKLDKKTGKFRQYKHNGQDSTSISSVVIKTIFQDSKGYVWFGTVAGGLCRYNHEQDNFTTFTERHGLANNTIYSILEDNEGNLWLGTNKGLSRFSLTTHTVTNYDSNDGLQSNQFAAGSSNIGSCFKGKDGTLYFGGNNGFNAFDPGKLDANSYVPPIVITGFRLFDQPLPGKNEAQEITLEYDQNFFSFEFAALNFTNSQKNQYAYLLESVDKDWVYSRTRRFVSYTDVAPGEYIFRVKGSNNNNIWNEQGTSIRILIHPPFWRTTWAYVFYGLCFLAGVYAVDRFQRRRLIEREREKARERELEQARELEKAYKQLGHQKEELQATLEDLQATQTQLIQKEKMASLGELTAGIAHEIQNPLNFVNNFSEVSTELIAELKEEIANDHKEDALAIADDLTQNLEKIHHHGKRADSIVKGMLQHSRASSGEKQLTDINVLAEEYLRLSYHGLRAKDKDFNAHTITDFNTKLGKLEVVPQELGRVLLNLFNNAFYATMQKKAQLNGQYQPEVKVSTRVIGNKIEIRVRDNGTGISESIKSKIFQPFFTTKPTGEGTGLGLSLSYDIITKGHGGGLKVETQVGNYSEFIVTLPKS